MSISFCGLGGRRLDLEVAVRVGATAALLASATMHSTMAAEHYGDAFGACTSKTVKALKAKAHKAQLAKLKKAKAKAKHHK